MHSTGPHQPSVLQPNDVVFPWCNAISSSTTLLDASTLDPAHRQTLLEEPSSMIMTRGPPNDQEDNDDDKEEEKVSDSFSELVIAWGIDLNGPSGKIVGDFWTTRPGIDIGHDRFRFLTRDRSFKDSMYLLLTTKTNEIK